MRLIAENLGGERGGETVFSGIGFALKNGQALVVTGPNGSGKSTLLRVIAGLLPKAEGEVRLEGGGETFPTIASAVHYLGHLNAMKTALSVARANERVIALILFQFPRERSMAAFGSAHIEFSTLLYMMPSARWSFSARSRSIASI